MPSTTSTHSASPSAPSYLTALYDSDSILLGSFEQIFDSGRLLGGNMDFVSESGSDFF